MKYMEQIGMRSKAASRSIGLLGQNRRNEALKQAAKELKKQAAFLLEENRKDIANAREKGMKESLIDRLMLTRERIAGIADGLLQIADLEDPIGIVTDMKVRPNGLRIGKKRVPLGVVGIIYESRPNVTADAFGLCLKSGNAVILRGGSDCIFSNKAIVSVLRKALNATQIEEDAVILIENTETRDQPKNRENAMRQLRSILYDKELQHRMAEQAKVEAGKKKIEVGSQIRSYVFDDRRVKDHRTNFQTSDVNGVMDGKIDGFIKAYLMEFAGQED